MDGQVVLQAVGLGKFFGKGAAEVRAVDGVSLELRRGEIVLIMGPSGSGKTTLLSLLGGLLRPSAGEILVEGVAITGLDARALAGFRARQVGFIFQAFNLLPSLTVDENVAFPASLLPRGEAAAARERARALVESLGLAPRRRFLPRDLSGGEMQRVAIARALVNDPKLILADEPTGNLDSRRGHDVMMRLHDVARDEGRTVLIVTHDPRVEEVADRVLWLEDGRLRDRRVEPHDWVRDPVCGMLVDRRGEPPSAERAGERFWFCSQRCLERFEAQPELYLEPHVGAQPGAEMTP